MNTATDRPKSSEILSEIAVGDLKILRIPMTLRTVKEALCWAYRNGYSAAESAAQELAEATGEKVVKRDMGAYGDTLAFMPVTITAPTLHRAQGPRFHSAALPRLPAPGRRGDPFVIRAGLLLAVFLALPATARERFARPGWADFDGDCRDTRAEVLAAQCLSVSWDAKGCHVLQAVCRDPYTGAEVASDSPQGFHVDHVFPASVAWWRGTWRLSSGEPCTKPSACPAFKSFFNDPLNLRVVRARTNLRKSDLMPGEWCPDDPAARPEVARILREAARAYRLPLLDKELLALATWDRGACVMAPSEWRKGVRQ